MIEEEEQKWQRTQRKSSTHCSNIWLLPTLDTGEKWSISKPLLPRFHLLEHVESEEKIALQRKDAIKEFPSAEPRPKHVLLDLFLSKHSKTHTFRCTWYGIHPLKV